MSRRTRILSETIFYVILIAGIALLFFVFSAKKNNSNKINSEVENLEVANIENVKENLNNSKIVSSKAERGYTLVPLSGSARVQLINMSGEQVHNWAVDAARARLLPNGNLLVIHGSKWGTFNQPWRGLRSVVREYDWQGNIVWEFKAPYIAHHDVQRLSNGNTLLVYRSTVPNEYKKNIIDLRRRQQKIRTDIILEVTPKGEIAWEWKAHEFLDLNSCGQLPCTQAIGDSVSASKASDWTHINTVSIIPENKHYEAGDTRFKPGNLIVIPRNWWTVLIVDRDSGKVVWEYTGDYQGGLSGGHESQMIEKHQAGAGNIIIFDNGVFKHQGQSFILEINPLTKKLEWVYDAGSKFYSNSSGSVQRLNNGNTLISEDLRARVFEVDREKQIVWSYQAPERVSRARRYPEDHCEQFKKLDLY